MSAMRILLQLLLNHQGQAVEALTHVRMAGRQPHPHAGRKRDHRRRSPWASAPTAADIVPASTEPVILTRAPFANSVSITPAGAGSAGAETGSGDTVTAAKVAAAA